MPIPFILGGIALAAGAYGVKKGLDANEDFDRADKLNSQAEKIYDRASSALNESKRNN